MDFNAFLQQAGLWFITSGLKIFLIFILLVIGLKLTNLLAERIFSLFHKRDPNDFEFQKRADTLSSVIRSLLKVLLFVVGAMMILGELGIQIGPIMAAAGVVGLAVGFGAQSLVQDVISGFFILLEDQVRVGDVVSIGDKGGLVEKINLRMIILRDIDGSVHYIRNGLVQVVTNMTKEYSFYVFDVGVSYEEDVDQVIAALKEIDEDMRRDPRFKDVILAPLEVFGLDKFDDSAMVIKARTKTRPIQQWNVGREFNRRILLKFNERGIEIPYPTQTVYFGQTKKGDAPPLRVESTANGSGAHEK